MQPDSVDEKGWGLDHDAGTRTRQQPVRRQWWHEQRAEMQPDNIDEQGWGLDHDVGRWCL
jgi:hypothetical protein